MKTPLCDRLEIEHPIIQAPMAGGATTPELVSAVCNAGALGSFAGATIGPEAILEGAAAIRKLTDRPFNVNLFVMEPPSPSDHDVRRALDRLAPFFDELGLPSPTAPAKYCHAPLEQQEAVLQAAPAVASFTFGLLDASTVRRFKAAGCFVMGTATNVAEARAWESVGADAVCAQGHEAGAHRGTFIGDAEQSSVGLMALLPRMADAVSIPVVAAGGIMDGRGIAAALILGAQAAQLGTAFLRCPESGIHHAWKERLAKAREDETRLTRVFSGRHARGIVNEFMERLRADEDAIPAYPIQNAMTTPLRKAAAQAGRFEFFSLWAGQGVGMSREMNAGALVRLLANELSTAGRG